MEHLKALAIGVAIIGILAGVIFGLNRIEWVLEAVIVVALLGAAYSMGEFVLTHLKTRR